MRRLLTGILLLPLATNAQLQLAPIFSNHMVLQRDAPVRIWGKSMPGKAVSVRFAGKEQKTLAGSDSSWRVSFPPQKFNASPQSIFITCDHQKIELKDVLIGDLWIASGQSNMEWPMIREMHWKAEAAYTDQPLIRLNNPPPAGRYVYGVPYTDSLNRRLTTDSFYLWRGWQSCDSNTVKAMSAVAYYFARSIVTRKQIPIGIINLSIGGAPIETFISKAALNRRFATKLKGNWLENKNLPEWVRQRGKQNTGGNLNGYGDNLGLNHAYKPGFAYAAGIEPLLALPVRGVIWYQGESNSLEKERVEEYNALMQLMISDYRAGWNQPEMPFYWVQLSSIDTTGYASKYWPVFRDEQRKLLKEVEHGGMAVCSDLGFRNDVHPTNKKDVGERLARWALKDVYHEDVVPSGPLPLHAAYAGGKVRITFQYATGLKTGDHETLRGFSLDGVTAAPAVIQNDEVIIPSARKPQFVYYGWKPYSDANLVNEEALPASTFKVPVR